MTLSLNKPKLDNLAGDIWKSAERLRGKFKAYEYQNVILPIIVIRRLECVLINWREKKRVEVLAKRPKTTEKELARLVKELELNPKQCPFSNKTNWTLRGVYEEDHALLEANFRAYINGFSKNVDDIIEHFNYRAIIGQMVKNNRLAPILNQYKELPLGPDQLSGLEMGYVYEELLRRFSEQSGEEAGEHFTPREVIRLMVELLEIPIPDRHFSVYDPAAGTGGMLSVAKEHLLDRATTPEEKERVEKFLTIHGQEMSPTNYAICQADLLIKNDRQATVTYGNSLIPHNPHSKDPGDQWPESKWRFNRMLSNPPFGVTWGGKDGYEAEARKLQATRYQAGMPPIDDGALLFVQTMLAKMVPPAEGGSRIAVIFNGSPLSSGDCGESESEIRRWLLENDWLDAIVMLPDQLFYNTGIFTYVWLLRNDRPVSHRGRVMLIDARQQFEDEPISFGQKRHRITDAHRAWIEERYRNGWAKGYIDEHVRIFQREDFAYHKVKVVFWQTDENDKPAIVTEPFPVQFNAQNVKKRQEFYDSEITLHIALTTKQGQTRKIDCVLKPHDNFGQVYSDAIASAFADDFDRLTKGTETYKERNRAIRKFTDSLKAEVSYTHRHYIKDDEYIPHGEDIETFLKREIAKPIIRWEKTKKDGKPILGYEILPNKYFYRYQPPTPAKQLLEEFWRLEKEAERMLEGLPNI